MSDARSITGFQSADRVFKFTDADDEIVLANIGDYGVENSNEQEVADLVLGWVPDGIFTNGDNSYNGDYVDDVKDYYDPYITNELFFPCPGNHDYESVGLTLIDYLDFFEPIIGRRHYYKKQFGPVTLFAMDSNIQCPDGHTSSSWQAQWLENQLALSETPWNIVSLHHAPYSSSTTSGGHGSTASARWDFSGADFVFSGHNHVYERLDNGDGSIYITNGLGGSPKYGFGTALTGSDFRYNSDFGAGKLIATPTRLVWRFYDKLGAEIDEYVLEK